VQLPLWAPESDWRPPSLSELPSWAGAKRVAMDCETRDPHLSELGLSVRRGGYIVGISFAIEDGPKFYLPYRHEGGDNLPTENVLAYLKEQCKAFDGDIVGANFNYDLDYLLEEGFEFPNVRYFRDIQLADPLINELHKSYSLQNIALRYGLPGKSEDLLIEAAQAFGVSPKSGMWRLPARYVGEYGEMDADQPLKILRKQEKIIDDAGLWEIYNLESEVLPVLVNMRRRGVRIDQDKLQQIEEWTLVEEAKALKVVDNATGVKVAVGDVWKSGAIAPALEYIGVKLEKTSTGQDSIHKDLLAGIDNPVAQSLAWARKVNKLRTTFAKSIRRFMVNGRINCTFNQIARETEKGDQKGARFGRLSSTDPNLQQQPSRDDFAAMWRSIYLPEEGGLWACCDYAQQEPRWTTHVAAVLKLPGALAAAQAYHDNPDLDNHQFMADLTGLPRKQAKPVYLGLCYGEGGAKLCDDLGLSTRWACATGRGRDRRVEYFESQMQALEARRASGGDGFVWRAAGEEGQRILDVFDERAPFIRLAAKRAEKKAKQQGFIWTAGKRRLHFPQKADGTYDWVHKAFNRYVQGSGADQMKRAMVEIERAGYWLMLQVHDEANNSVDSPKEAKIIGEIMSNVMPAKVPFKVDVEIGPSWGEAK